MLPSPVRGCRTRGPVAEPLEPDGQLPLLLVDDEAEFLASFRYILEREGFSVVTAPNGREALALVQKQPFAGVFLDIVMPVMDGRAALPELLKLQPELPVVMMTALFEVETVVGCMRAGAYDYLLKPVERTALLSCARRLVQLSQVHEENRRLRRSLAGEGPRHPELFAEFTTATPRMLEIFGTIEALAPTQRPLLVTGETGTGKELAARAIHSASGRAGPFVAENIAGIDDALFADALFGHARGAFTGADRPRRGLLETAAGGTLFLDEIGDLNPESQKKLLRVLQEREFSPVGSEERRPVTCRLVLATHRDLKAMVVAGQFREDLYYRVQAHRLHLPPLRERPLDLGILARKFLDEACTELGRKALQVPPELEELLASHDWPGNVRELRGLLFNSVSHSPSGHLRFDSMLEAWGRIPGAAVSAGPEGVGVGSTPAPAKSGAAGATGGTAGATAPGDAPLLLRGDHFPTLAEADEFLVATALARCGENRTQAARLLGLTREALSKRISRKSAG